MGKGQARSNATTPNTEVSRQDVENMPEKAMPEPNLAKRLRALSKIVDVMDERDIPALLRAIADLPPGAEKTALLSAALVWLGDSDPKAAIDWVLGLPEKDRPPNILTLIASQWAKYDPASAMGSVMTLSPGNEQTQAMKAVASEWAATDLQGAVSWADTIGDPQMRVETTMRVVSRLWIKMDPQAAQEWIVQSSLSPDQKVQLLNSAK